MNYNWKKHYAIKQQYEKEWGWLPRTPGIYLWTRYDAEINKTYFYVGQAKNLFNRRFDYYKIQTGLSYPTRHFEASLKAHKDWKYEIICECREEVLNELEANFIKEYMRKDNYITRNDALTGSDITKTNANRISKIKKEYEEGIKKCLKHLDVSIIDDLSITIMTKRSPRTKAVSLRSLDAMKNLKERLGLKND